MEPAELAALLPDGCVVDSVVPRTGGSLNTVHEVRLAGGGAFIVKRYAERFRAQQAKEVYVYGLLAGVGPVPRIVRVDHERARTVLTMLPGRPMWECALDPAATRRAYQRIGRFQAALHRIRMPAFGDLATSIVDPVTDNVTHMRRKFAAQLDAFLAAGGPPDIHAAAARRAADGVECFAACTQAVLCHHDLHEGNVLVDDAGAVTGFLDVENAAAADPMSDLAKTLVFEESGSPATRAALLDGYGPLPPHGEQRIELYEMFHALELWTWHTSTGQTKHLAGLIATLRSRGPG